MRQRSTFDIRQILPVLCLTAALTLLPRLCMAQNRPAPLPFVEHAFLKRAVQIYARQTTFPDAIAKLSTTAGISVMTDGVPDKAKADLDVTGTVRQALDAICAAFDCRWSVSKTGIVMLSRRFADPAERPQVHLLEMQRMLRDIRAALDVVPPEIVGAKYGKLLERLADSFSDEQLAASKAGMLTGADLDAEQFVWLNGAILNKSFANAIVSLDQFLPVIDELQRSFLQCRPGIMRPDPNLFPGTAAVDDARFPAFDYTLNARGKDGKLRTFYLINTNMVTEGAGR